MMKSSMVEHGLLGEHGREGRDEAGVQQGGNEGAAESLRHSLILISQVAIILFAADGSFKAPAQAEGDSWLDCSLSFRLSIQIHEIIQNRATPSPNAR